MIHMKKEPFHICGEFFSVHTVFWEDFQRSIYSIHIPEVTKRSLNVCFILGKTGYA